MRRRGRHERQELRRIQALAAAAGMTVEQFLRQAADRFLQGDQAPASPPPPPRAPTAEPEPDWAMPRATSGAQAQAAPLASPVGGDTIYARLGHAGGLRRLVNDFYPRVLADPQLYPYFAALDEYGMRGLRWHVLTFLAMVTGGPSKYLGRDIGPAHAPYRITNQAYDRLLEHLEATMHGLEIVTLEDQFEILGKVEDLRTTVVTGG